MDVFSASVTHTHTHIEKQLVLQHFILWFGAEVIRHLFFCYHLATRPATNSGRLDLQPICIEKTSTSCKSDLNYC